ncbi:lectin [Armillaria luteobubalina]|uniref:Lectin n=1 Tax=Armillaria luteobubalina TaxID=153913 RepID=A0AA39Q2F4_9AGAR|nr:lectin [Armillaria luteobubalina]
MLGGNIHRTLAMLLKVVSLLSLALVSLATSHTPALEDANTGQISDLLSARSALEAREEFTSLYFDNAKWIWTSEPIAVLGPRPFRKRVLSSNTKCPVCATIILSSDDIYTLNVNGREIGTGEGWGNVVTYTVGLEPEGDNVFAIQVNNTIGSGGTSGAGPLIATILVHYKDGSTTLIYTDTTWKALSSVPPAGWTSPSFDDSKWETPVVKLAGTQTAWGAPWVYPPAVDMTPAQTIWTDEVKDNIAPVGHRAFRTTIMSPYGKAAMCGRMVITTDDNYTLYVNGDYLGHGTGYWPTMEAYSVPILDPDVNVIAVDGENMVPSPGGTSGPNNAMVLAGIVIAYDDGSSATYYTSKNWKAAYTVPSGFEQKDYDDGYWMAASEYGTLAASSYKDSTFTIPRA